MKIVALSTSDTNGGAALAALRLNRGLQALGVDAELWVQRKYSGDPHVRGRSGPLNEHLNQLRLLLDQLPVLRTLGRGRPQFSPAWIPGLSWRDLAPARPSVVHLHWINKGYISIEALARIPCPVVWTLHDMWPITGGCHYDEGCGRFMNGCGHCPVLRSKRPDDASHRIYRRKHDAYRKLRLCVVSPSRWLAKLAMQSPLLADKPVHVIPNGLDLATFSVGDRAACRTSLGIPAEARVVAFGAMNATDDVRKGYRYLITALAALGRHQQGLHLLVYGGKPLAADANGIPMTSIGRVASEPDMAKLLNAADVFVAPSVQDNLPNTVVEALACGCPVVGFGIGGMPDLVQHEKNGYLAQPFETADLAAGITWVLADQQRHLRLRGAARRHAEEHYALDKVAKAYFALYGTLVQ